MMNYESTATIGTVAPRAKGKQAYREAGLESAAAQLQDQNISQGRRGLVAINCQGLLLLFVVGSIAGLIIEVIFHLVAFGALESRAGLVWGPFSPLYGVGAVILTLALNWLWRLPGLGIFVASAFVGSVVEFACSWWMEYFFGAVAWDYSGTFLNIDGRVNFMFACMWGALGYLWARLVMPAMSRRFERIDWKKPALRVASCALAVFLLVNITLTVQAFDRESQRALGIPAATNYEMFLDEYFSSSWMADRFENMSIYGASQQ